ncbi:hypothetical protein Bca52824_095917, partial [Brassica carinata]
STSNPLKSLVHRLQPSQKVASSPEVPTILKDCLKEMKDTADELKQVFAEIINAGRISKGRSKGSWKRGRARRRQT